MSESGSKEETQGTATEPHIIQTFCLEDGTTTIQTVANHNVTEYTITQDVNKEGDVIVVTEDGQTFTLDKDSAALITQNKDVIGVQLDEYDATCYALIDGENGKRKSTYKCPFEGCSKHYSSQHHLKVHMRNHTGDRPFVCGCSKSFTTKYGLKAHIRTHTGEKPYKCRSCEKSFKTSGDLQKHIRTHTGERPFKCNFPNCDKSFTTSNIRKVHLRTHTGERPYTCTKEGCGRTFSSATNYKNHARIHTGEKPYHCTVQDCGKRFTEYSSLYKHSVVHSGTKPYTCFMCGRHYRQTTTLISHKKAAHGIWENPDGTHIYLKDMPNHNDSLVVISDDAAQGTSATHILVLSDSQVVPLSEVTLGTNGCDSTAKPVTEEETSSEKEETVNL